MMKLTTKQTIFLIISGIVLFWIAFMQIKCNKLQKELNDERLRHLECVDSLTWINNQHLKDIDAYTSEIINLQKDNDSLMQLKNKIIYQKDGVVVSENISAGVKQLKMNLARWSD